MTFAEPQPFDEALAFARQKKLMPTSLSSRALQSLKGEITRRSTFSARVSVADILAKLQSVTATIAGGLTEDGAVAGTQEPGDRMLSIPEAKAQLREMALSLGWQPDNPADVGTIKDIRTDARLQLMVETNVLDTLNAGRWQAGQDEVALDVNPAWELVRVTNSEKPRDWEQRWQAARAASVSDGATDGNGRMVALKNHPIWQALGDGAGGYEDTLGNPWAPFAFNSGMSTIDVPRGEAIALGLLTETTVIEPQERGLNDGLEVNATRFDAAMQRALADDPALAMRDGVLTIRNRAANAKARGLVALLDVLISTKEAA